MTMQLIIKAPNQVTPDQSVEAQPDWTVLRLKEFLSEIYPSHPAVEEQKLIHAGRLLHNHLLLKEILRQEGPLHVLHLVCNGQSSNQPMSSSKVSPSQSDVGPVPMSSSPVDSRNVPSSPLAPGLHYRGPRQHPDRSVAGTGNVWGAADLSGAFPSVGGSSTSAYQFQVPVGAPPGMALSPEILAQQMAAMQQFYAHYMAQFMQHAQAAGMGPFPDLSTLGTSGTPADSSVAPGQDNDPEAAAAPQEPPRANQNLRMNAQGGGPLFEEDDDANRDWLDWFYIFCRAFVLFSIVYFYSSLGRFMVVVGITILIYMYQGGWFGAGRRQENRPEQQVPAEERQEPEQNQQLQPQEQGEEEENEMESVTQDQVPPQQQQEEPPTALGRLSNLNTVWVFIKTFFSSLLPEQPPPINVN